MKKFIKMLSFLLVITSVATIQSCKEDEDPKAAPIVTAPATVASVQVGTKADVTFNFQTAGGFSTAAVAATGGTATVKTPGAAGAETGTVVVEFTADNTAGAATVTLTITDSDGQTGNATGTLNKTISAPPSIALSAPGASVNPGANTKVTVTITAANGVKSLAYTTTGGLVGSPASPINLTTTTQELTFTVPANATIGTALTAVITATDNQNLNSTAATFTVTATTNELTGILAEDRILTKGTPYLIKGNYIVPAGRTLTVQPGAIIKGDKASKAVLVIKQGGTLNAIGTETEPIVFTSSQSVGERDRGDWGGIVIMGDAFVNQSAKPVVEGLTAPVGETDFYRYGTNSTSDANAGNNTQNSGTLKYVRIEYAGIELIPNSETNTLTFAGVGSGTTVDYVQASYGGDDAFEWFGGTVSAKHLVSLATWDDDFDTDFGWRGNVQWGVVVRAPFVADQSGSTAFESDSQGNGNAIGTICATPAGGTGAAPATAVAGSTGGCTQGVFSNITVYGPKELAGRAINANYTRAMHIRRRTAISVFNSVITGWPQGLAMDDQGTLDNYKGGIGVFENNILFIPIAPTSTSNANFAAGNSYFGTNVSGGVSDPGPTQSGTVASFWTTGNTLVGGTIVTSAAATQIPNWATTANAADNTINPYTEYGLTTGAPFYVGSSQATYLSNPTFAITSGLLTGQTAATLFANAKLGSFFDKTLTYKGAFGTTDWTDGWSEFQPVNKAY